MSIRQYFKPKIISQIHERFTVYHKKS